MDTAGLADQTDIGNHHILLPYRINSTLFQPQESLFIDDAPANIETAAQLGFKTLLYDVNKNLEEELNRVLK